MVAAVVQRPEPAPNEPLRRRDAPQHVDEHADGVVRDVGRVDRPRVGDGDAAVRALGEVDVVNARGRADEAADGGEESRCLLARGQLQHAEALVHRVAEGRAPAADEEHSRDRDDPSHAAGSSCQLP